MTSFEGFVSRQELINFCRARIVEMEKESDQYLALLNKVGGKLSYDDASALNDAISANIGEQRAYRKICDWAADNIVEDSLAELRYKEGYNCGFDDAVDEMEEVNV